MEPQSPDESSRQQQQPTTPKSPSRQWFRSVFLWKAEAPPAAAALHDDDQSPPRQHLQQPQLPRQQTAPTTDEDQDHSSKPKRQLRCPSGHHTLGQGYCSYSAIGIWEG